MIKYVAFLRGINVGGNVLIKMEDLKKVFSSLKFKNVQTMLASGKVIFEATGKKLDITKKIEEILREKYKREIGVIVRSIEELERLVNVNPFKNIRITEQTRLYVTFLSEKSGTKLKIPYESPENDFKILSANDSELCSVITISQQKNSTDFMKILEKEFGKKITTRNWNTVQKIIKK